MDSKRDIGVWFAGIVYFIVIPLVLVTVFVFSESLKESLLLYPKSPTFLSMLGSNFLHTDLFHLLSNLVLYLVLMVLVFTFDALTNPMMLFVNMILLFVLLPLVSSLANVVGFSFIGVNHACLGFSAVVAGLFGYLAFSFLHYIKEYHTVRFERGIFQLLWFILYINLALISVIYGFYLGAVVLCVLIGLSFYYTYKDLGKIFQLGKTVQSRFHRVLILLSLFFCLSTVTQALFPERLVVNGMVVNILAHYVGYMVGFFVPAVVSVYIVERRKEKGRE
ncbi:MAG: hypothetical protein JW840_05280 [Candidatus Thermoplasmatota archaeon]|nr:hypothetical protein [Candidatus Thermoplasmatota archaeon]